MRRASGTENDQEATTLSWDAFVAKYYPREDDYCSLYETDNYAWFQGGRNLYDSKVLSNGSANEYTVSSTGTSASGSVTVCVSAVATTSGGSVEVRVNGESVGSITIPVKGTYDSMRTAQRTFTVNNLQGSNTISLIPNIGYRRSNITEAQEEQHSILNNLATDLNLRMSLFWNNTRVFNGIIFETHTYSYRKSKFGLTNTYGTLKYILGFNFWRKPQPKT